MKPEHIRLQELHAALRMGLYSYREAVDWSFSSSVHHDKKTWYGYVTSRLDQQDIFPIVDALLGAYAAPGWLCTDGAHSRLWFFNLKR